MHRALIPTSIHEFVCACEPSVPIGKVVLCMYHSINKEDEKLLFRIE